MHDCLEGVIPVTVRLVLLHVHRLGLTSVDELNNQLSNITLPPSSCKPNLFQEHFFRANGKIVGSASQKLELFLVLPQIVPANSLSDCPAWDVYLCLRECMDYILSPFILRSSLHYLSGLIENYLAQFCEVFGKECLLPKHHFMLHYPAHIMKFGPLRNVWCMRFEARHQYFKHLTINTKKFINITKTLANRHQMKLSHALSSSQYLSETCFPVSACSYLKWSKLPGSLQLALVSEFGDAIRQEHLQSVSSLSCYNLLYQVDRSAWCVLDVIPPDEVPCLSKQSL